MAKIESNPWEVLTSRYLLSEGYAQCLDESAEEPEASLRNNQVTQRTNQDPLYRAKLGDEISWL